MYLILNRCVGSVVSLNFIDLCLKVVLCSLKLCLGCKGLLHFGDRRLDRIDLSLNISNVCVGSVGVVKIRYRFLERVKLFSEFRYLAVCTKFRLNLFNATFKLINGILQCRLIALVVNELCINGGVCSDRSSKIKRGLICSIRKPAHEDVAVDHGYIPVDCGALDNRLGFTAQCSVIENDIVESNGISHKDIGIAGFILSGPGYLTKVSAAFKVFGVQCCIRLTGNRGG